MFWFGTGVNLRLSEMVCLHAKNATSVLGFSHKYGKDQLLDRQVGVYFTYEHKKFLFNFSITFNLPLSLLSRTLHPKTGADKNRRFFSKTATSNRNGARRRDVTVTLA